MGPKKVAAWLWALLVVVEEEAPAADAPPAVLELDERWTFVGKRTAKVWLWLAVERSSRRIVAWALGCRGAATARRLWQALPPRYQQHTRAAHTLLHRCVGSLRQSAAGRRPLPQPQGQRTDQPCRGYQLCTTPALRGAGTQILFVQ